MTKYIGDNRTVKVTESDMKCLLKCEMDQSVDLSATDKLSSSTINQLNKVSRETGIGPIKLSYSLPDRNNGSNLLEFIGFIREHTVLVDANKSERYHGLLVIGEQNIL